MSVHARVETSGLDLLTEGRIRSPPLRPFLFNVWVFSPIWTWKKKNLENNVNL